MFKLFKNFFSEISKYKPNTNDFYYVLTVNCTSNAFISLIKYAVVVPYSIPGYFEPFLFFHKAELLIRGFLTIRFYFFGAPLSFPVYIKESLLRELITLRGRCLISESIKYLDFLTS